MPHSEIKLGPTELLKTDQNGVNFFWSSHKTLQNFVEYCGILQNLVKSYGILQNSTNCRNVTYFLVFLKLEWQLLLSLASFMWLHASTLVPIGKFTRTVLWSKSAKFRQVCIALYKNESTPLRTRGNNTTHQHFQLRYITLIYLKGLKSY